MREAGEGLNVDHLVLFEGDGDGTISLDELREKGRDNGDAVDERIDGRPDDVFTLIIFLPLAHALSRMTQMALARARGGRDRLAPRR